MMRFAQVTVAGVASIILLKLIATLLLPFLGWVVGFIVLMFKVALVVLVGYLVFSFFRRRKCRTEEDE
jgi:hypothetical protein